MQGLSKLKFHVKKDQDLSASSINVVHVKQEGKKFFRALQSPQEVVVEETYLFRCCEKEVQTLQT